MDNHSFVKSNIFNFVFKLLIYLLEFVNISLTIHYLGDYIYGEWVTIITIFMWVNSCDFGIGNGLRNKLVSEIESHNVDEIRKMISTSYIMIGILSLFFALTGIFLSIGLIHVNFYDKQFLYPLLVCVAGFSFNFVASLSRAIGYSYQKSEYIMCTQLLNSAFICIGIILLNQFSEKNLLFFSFVYIIGMAVPNLFLMLWLQYHHKEEYKIRLSFFSLTYSKEIVLLGMKFFVLQVVSLVMYSTDTVILKILLGSEAVTQYDIIDKIFKAGNELFSVLLIATWSAVTCALSQNDFKWIKNNLRQLVKMWCVFSIGVFGVLLMVDFIVKIWMQSDKYSYSFFARCIFAFHCIILAWNGIFVNISNGLGKLDIQLKSSIIAVLINIPISILFIKYLHMGIAGAKAGTIISILCIAVPMTIDILQYIRKHC